MERVTAQNCKSKQRKVDEGNGAKNKEILDTVSFFIIPILSPPRNKNVCGFFVKMYNNIGLFCKDKLHFKGQTAELLLF